MNTLNTDDIQTKEIIHEGEVIGEYEVQELLMDDDLLCYYLDELSYKLYMSTEQENIKDFFDANFVDETHYFFGKKIILLHKIMIEEKYRGKGKGSLALAVMEEEMKAEGYDFLCLKPYPIAKKEEDDFQDIYQQVRRFYKKNGYQLVNDLVPYPYMYKQLAD